ncbi:PPPDE_peptidase domain-containing protein [Hexamita inflata]|uniref:PPPDE_peptidase domain-containing protein n=1 Tax=Hexamita inflata TaxID=28002 RepID=A0ABP1HLV7_9EUKA
MLKKETINEQYKSLYLEEPRAQIPENLSDVITALHTDSEDNLFNQHAIQLVVQVQNRQDFVASNEFHKTVSKILKELSDPKLDSTYSYQALFNLLACVSLTNSVFKLEHDVYPDVFFSKLNPQNMSEMSAFMKYLNNWLLSVPGMKELRDNDRIVKFLLQKVKTTQDDVLVNTWRALFSATRALTHKQLTQEFVDQLIQEWKELSTNQQAKPFGVCFNLACGAVGRITLTLLDQDATRGNELKRNLKKMAVPMEIKAVCVSELKLFISAERKREVDEMF